MTRPFVLASVLLAGCVRYSVEYTSSHPTHPAPRPVETVEVLSFVPSRSYLEIGRIEVQAIGGRDPARRGVQELRIAAAGRGCDAVVVTAASRNHGRYQGACVIYP
jgi:hypothetical protein